MESLRWRVLNSIKEIFLVQSSIFSTRAISRWKKKWTTVSVPIVAETCARRGAGFSRFLQLVPGEGESQTTGKLCVLHFFYKGQLNIASLCIGRNEAKVGLQCKLLNLAIELNCCTKIPRKRHFAR